MRILTPDTSFSRRVASLNTHSRVLTTTFTTAERKLHVGNVTRTQQLLERPNTFKSNTSREWEVFSFYGWITNPTIEQPGSGALQVPFPAPLARWTRLVSAPAVVQDTTQPIRRSRGVSLLTVAHWRRHSLQRYCQAHIVRI